MPYCEAPNEGGNIVNASSAQGDPGGTDGGTHGAMHPATSTRGAQPCPTPTAWTALPPKGQATAELCCFCFQVLSAHLQSQPPPQFPLTADPSFQAPFFVTWLKRRRGGAVAEVRDLELRGCIGCLEPIAFRPGLSDYALRSSLQDRRFPPVRLEEVPSLTCRLSILHQFEACTHIHDWQIGTHGVWINFVDARGRSYSATYLPEVAREHSMTREVAIRELVIKSGYVGPCDQELLAGIEVTRYQTLVESVAHEDFQRGLVRTPEALEAMGAANGHS